MSKKLTPEQIKQLKNLQKNKEKALKDNDLIKK